MESIQCLVGDVGAGKSLNMVVAAIQGALRGRDVYMNFPLKPLFAERYPELAIRIHYIQDFYGFLEQREKEAEHTPFIEFQDLFLVDEAWAIWNSRRSMEPFQKMTTNYIFISRKIGLELRMTSQLASNLDKRARLLVQLWIVATKIQYGGQYYFQYEYYSPDIKEEVKTTYLTPEVAKKYYPYYWTTGPTSVGASGGLSEAEISYGPEVNFVTEEEFVKFKNSTSDKLKVIMADLKELKGRK